MGVLGFLRRLLQTSCRMREVFLGFLELSLQATITKSVHEV